MSESSPKPSQDNSEEVIFTGSLTRQEKDLIGRRNAIVIDGTELEEAVGPSPAVANMKVSLWRTIKLQSICKTYLITSDIARTTFAERKAAEARLLRTIKRMLA